MKRPETTGRNISLADMGMSLVGIRGGFSVGTTWLPSYEPHFCGSIQTRSFSKGAPGAIRKVTGAAKVGLLRWHPVGGSFEVGVKRAFFLFRGSPCSRLPSNRARRRSSTKPAPEDCLLGIKFVPLSKGTFYMGGGKVGNQLEFRCTTDSKFERHTATHTTIDTSLSPRYGPAAFGVFFGGQPRMGLVLSRLAQARHILKSSEEENDMSKGRRLALSPMRRTMIDLMYFAKQVPTVICQRRMKLQPLIDARQNSPQRPSWSSLFAKAFSRVAVNYPELRQSYLPYPRPCLYEHPHSIAALTIERQIGDEDVVLFGHFREPENRELAEFNEYIYGWKNDPIETIKKYQLAHRASYFPGFIRRIGWGILLNWVGKTRAKTFGTFGLTSTASSGAGMLQILSILTSTLHYGMFDQDGSIEMRLTFDHRVYDGAFAARIMGEMEQSLLTEMLQEVKELTFSRKGLAA